MQPYFWCHGRPQPSIEKYHRVTILLFPQLRDTQAGTHHPDCPQNRLTTSALWQLVGSLPCAQRGAARHSSLLSYAGSQESWEPPRVIAWDKFTGLGGFPSKAASTLFSIFLHTLESMSIIIITRALQLFYPTSKSKLKKNKILDIPEGKDVFQVKGHFRLM